MRNKHRFTRTTLSIALGGLLTLIAGTAAATTWDFESLQLGTQFVVGNFVNLPDADVQMKQFLSGGVWLQNGVATVDDNNEAHGSGNQEIWFTNINASVIPDTPANFVSFLYADIGGPINFGCNGLELVEASNFSDLDGEWVGGCEITVTVFGAGPYSNEYGEVIIEPGPGQTIEKFGIGGEEFFVDDLCIDC